MSSSAGQSNGVLYGTNLNFTGTTPHVGQITADGQLLIGNAVFPYIRAGTITSPDGSLVVGYSAPNITLQQSGGVRYPITPYVVGPIGVAGYQTIQSALDAADAAGGGVVYIMPDQYTENLTLYDGVHLYGTPAVSQNQGATTTIIGTHTPPTSGQVAFNSICFVSTTDVFSSVAAGTTHLAFLNCESAVQNGYFLNLLNWTGTLEIYDNNPNTAGAPFAVNDGGINNTGGSTILVFSASVGSGTNVMNLSGLVITEGASFGCPVNFQTGSNFNLQGHEFLAPVTFSNNATGVCYFCDFEGGAAAAITMSSSGAISLLHGVVNSSNNPAIDGAGVGVLTYSNLVFRDNAAFAGTLTLATLSWRPYARAIASTDGTQVGTAAFNSAHFSVDANGFVSSLGAGFPWIDQGSSTTIASNTGYFATGAVTLTLPASPLQGDTIKIICDTASAVVVQGNTGQTIRQGTIVSSSAGTFTNTARGDALELIYRAATTEWIAINGNGTWIAA